jgi:membrane fusion protein (multidrug efflux system)
MLTLDRAIGDKWLVLSGLASGENVIVEGMQKVHPGVAVKAVPFDPNEKAGIQPPPQNPMKRGA